MQLMRLETKIIDIFFSTLSTSDTRQMSMETQANRMFSLRCGNDSFGDIFMMQCRRFRYRFTL